MFPYSRWVWCPDFRVQGLGSRVEGLGLRVEGFSLVPWDFNLLRVHIEDTQRPVRELFSYVLEAPDRQAAVAEQDEPPAQSRVEREIEKSCGRAVARAIGSSSVCNRKEMVAAAG